MDELRDITINQTFRTIEKDMTEKSVNVVKEKIKRLCSDTSKQFKKQGRSIPKAFPDDKSLFPQALGNYVKSKQIPLAIQQTIIGKLSDEEMALYNNVYSDYMRNKRRLNTLDERIT